MKISRHSFFSCSLAIALILPFNLTAQEEPDIINNVRDYYSEAGLNSSDSLSQNINEHIDPFSGTLQIKHTDLVIPGNGGLDIVLTRTYTSPQDYIDNHEPNPIGFGWSMHMGKIIGNGHPDNMCNQSTLPGSLDNPSLEFPDGGRELLMAADNTIFTSLTPHHLITKSNWKAICISRENNGSSDGFQGLLVTSPNGTVYTMNEYSTFIDNQGNRHHHWYTTKIEDLHGNQIVISYNNNSGFKTINKIGDFLDSNGEAAGNRLVTFNYLNGHLNSITANGETWQYDYSDSPDVPGQHLLERVTPPDSNGGDWEYDYYPYSAEFGEGALEKITYPQGGTISYQYADKGFTDNIPGSPTNTVVSRKETGGSNITNSGVWTFTYQPQFVTVDLVALPVELDPNGVCSNVTQGKADKTTVNGPDATREYVHLGGWKENCNDPINKVNFTTNGVGLKIEEKITKDGVTEITKYGWEYRKISDEYYSLGSTRSIGIDPETLAPYLTGKSITREGRTLSTVYSDHDIYGFPERVIQIAAIGSQSYIVDYEYKHDAVRWILGLVETETLNNVKLSQTGPSINAVISRDYYNEGTLQYEDKYGVRTDYTYHSDGNLNTVSDDNGNVSNYSNYKLGIARQELHPVGTGATSDPYRDILISRTIKDEGTVGSQTNGRNKTTSFSYDGQNRLKTIGYPKSASEGVNVSYTKTTRTLTRGNFTQTDHFDGFGRIIQTDRTDSSTSTTISKTFEYDAIGRLVFESYPSEILPAEGIATDYDALGRVIRVTNTVDDTYKEFIHDANLTTVHDERFSQTGYKTIYKYQSYGSFDNQKVINQIITHENDTVIDRNLLNQPLFIGQGQIQSGTTDTIQGEGRFYNYNNNFFLVRETHPETGDTVYTHDEVGNVKTSKIGASEITTYHYDRGNRLIKVDYPSGTPDVTYKYDDNNNIDILTTTDDTRWDYDYDDNDNLTLEKLTMDEVEYPLNYGYDSLDSLSSITYPDDLVVNYSPDAFGRPTQASGFASNILYHANGSVKSYSLNNGLSVNVGLTPRLFTDTIAVSGGESIANFDYDYDPVGNLTSITNGANANTQINNAQYDGLNRLASVNGPWGLKTFEYDKQSNIRSKTFIDNMGVSNTWTYTYEVATLNAPRNILYSVRDQSGGLSVFSPQYDDYGSIKRIFERNKPTTDYEYNDASNLTRIYNSNIDKFYSYDGNKQRALEINNLNGFTKYSVYSKSGQLKHEYIPYALAGSDCKDVNYIYLGSLLLAKHENTLDSCSVVAPVAINDFAVTTATIPVDILPIANDKNFANAALNIVNVTSPVNGVAVLAGNKVTYTANAGFTGDDSFEYTISDGVNNSKATITITVNPDYLISELSFNDVDFAICVSNAATSNGWTNVSQFTSLSCSTSNTLSTSDLAGIEQLTELEVLNLSSHTYINNRRISSIDLTSMSKLRELYLNDNLFSRFSSDMLASSKSLEILGLSENQLTEIDINDLVNLRELNIGKNSLETIDVSKLSNLTKLYVDDNNLAELDVSGLSSLNYLSAQRNSIASLNLAGAKSLNALLVNTNQLVTLDVTNSTFIITLDLDDNNLTDISTFNLLSAPTTIKLINNNFIPCGQLDTLESSFSSASIIRPANCFEPDNNPAKAVDDIVVTRINKSIDIPILLNDTDPNGDTLFVNSVDSTSAQGASVWINEDKESVSYNAPSDFSGVDTFEYQVSDGKNGFDNALVVVRVNPIDIPAAVNDVYVQSPPRELQNINYISLPQLNLNDELTSTDADIEGDNLTYQLSQVSAVDQFGSPISIERYGHFYIDSGLVTPENNGGIYFYSDQTGYCEEEGEGNCNLVFIGVLTFKVNVVAGSLDSTKTITVTVDTRQTGNTKPNMNITSTGLNGGTFDLGDTLNFTASANDDEDGNLAGSIVWESSVDGILSTGGNINIDTLSPGLHIITASVTDSNDITSYDYLSFTVLNAPIVPTIHDMTFKVDAALALNTVVADINDQITGVDYTNDAKPISYQILSGNVGGVFAIDSSTGELTNQLALDFITTPQYTMVIEASDGSLNDTATIKVAEIGSSLNPIANDDVASVRSANEALANTKTIDSQRDPSVSALSDGGFIVSWDSRDPNIGDTYGSGVVAQRFTWFGVKSGSEFLVNVDPSGVIDTQSNYEDAGEVVTFPDGRYIITYASNRHGASKSLAQIYSASGATEGGTILLEETTRGTSPAKITVLENGNFVATWHSYTNSWDVYARVFSPTGQPITSEIDVSENRSRNQYLSDVVALSDGGDGGFLVTWVNTDSATGDGNGSSVMGKRYSAGGVPDPAGAFVINTNTLSEQLGGIAIRLNNNNIVVAWASYNSADHADGFNVVAQVLDGATLAKIGGELSVNSRTVRNQTVSDMIALSDGGFMVMYQHGDAATGDGDDSSLIAQRFNETGDKAGREFIVNLNSEGSQFGGRMHQLANDDVVMVWTTDDPTTGDESSMGIGMRIYKLGSELPLLVDVLANDTDPNPDDTVDTFSLDSVTLLSGEGVVSIDGNQIHYEFGDEYDYLSLNETATAMISYVMSDDEGYSDQGLATITIEGINNAPEVLNGLPDAVEYIEGINKFYRTPVDAFFDADQGTTLNTLNATLIDGSPLPIWLSDRHFGNGTREFFGTPSAADNGTLDVRLTVSDGQYSVSDTFRINILRRLVDSDIGNILNGSSGRDKIEAYGGDDTLDGLAGADILIGGTGNDTYYIDDAGDEVIEQADEGIDSLIVSVQGDYVLPDNFENLDLADVTYNQLYDYQGGIGNDLDNVLTVNTRTETHLMGGAGNDTLIIPSPNDRDHILSGGVGEDRYILHANSRGTHRINVGEGDSIVLHTSDIANVTFSTGYWDPCWFDCWPFEPDQWRNTPSGSSLGIATNNGIYLGVVGYFTNNVNIIIYDGVTETVYTRADLDLSSLTLPEGSVSSSLLSSSSPPLISASSASMEEPVSEGDTVTLSFVASASTNGSTSDTVEWSSSIDGTLGTGNDLTVSSLSAGEHALNARVLDSGGLVKNSSIAAMSVGAVGIGVLDTGYTLNYDSATETEPSDSIWNNTNGLSNYNLSHQAVLNASPTTNHVRIEKAYSFNGSSGATMLDLQGLSGNPTNNSASFELWFKAADLTDTDVLYETGAAGDGTSFILTDTDGDGEHDDLQFIIKDSATTLKLTADLSSQLGSASAVTDEFIQVVGTYNRNTSGGTLDIMKLYVNGQFVTLNSSTSLNDWAGGNDTGLGQVNGNINIGKANVTNFEGDIAIFRFYEKVLSETEVLDNYNYVVTGGAP